MEEELAAIKRNENWQLVDLPKDKKAIANGSSKKKKNSRQMTTYRNIKHDWF